MQIQVKGAVDGTLDVALVGRLDTAGVDGVETKLTAHAMAPATTSATVDLSGVEFVGSMAIRMFITLARALSRKGGKLVLYGAQPLVQQVFEMASLDTIVPVRADAAAAAAAARA